MARRKNSRNNNNKARGNDSKRNGRQKEWNEADPVKPGSKSNNSIKDFRHVMAGNGADNDPSWYNKISSYFADVSNVPYNSTLGLPVNMNLRTVPILMDGKQYQLTADEFNVGNVIPGIMTIDIAPTIGQSANSGDPANIAGQQLYNIIRKHNSGSVNNYDQTDVMMLVLGIDSAYMLYEECLRAYRLLGSFNYANRYYPSYILESLGFSPMLADSLADFRGVLDLFAYQLASINIPDQFSLLERHSWMYSNIYTDGRDYKAQSYAFKPDGFYVWKEGSEGTATYLKYTKRSEVYGTEDLVQLSDIRKAINTLMTPLLGSGDVGLISGDIAKAFGESGMISIAPVKDHEFLDPVFSEEVLMQIENMDWISNDVLNNDIKVNYNNTVAGPLIVCNPCCKAAYFDAEPVTVTALPRAMRDSVLNMHTNTPSPDDTMVATRLKHTIDWDYTDEGIGTSTPYPIKCGTEIVTYVTIHIMEMPNGSMSSNYLYQDRMYGAMHINVNGNGVATASAGTFDIVQDYVYGSNFDWGPMQYNWILNINYVEEDGSSEISGVRYLGIAGDVDNYTTLDNNTLDNINKCAVMSEFAVTDYLSLINK